MSAPLERVIGQRALTLAIINSIVASGIFGLPAALAADLGRAAILAYAVCTVLFLGVALCFAEAGSRVAASGGLYAYAGEAFGPLTAALAGTLLWVSCIFANAAVASLFVDTVSVVLPALQAPGIRPLLVVATYVAATLLNVVGVQSGVRTTEVLTAIKLGTLGLLVVVGLWHLDPSRIAFHALPARAGFAHAVVLLAFAFTGAENALCVSGEVSDSARTVPRAVLVGISVTAAFYVALQLVAQSALGDGLAGFTKAPLAEASAVLLPGWGRGLVVIAALCCTGGYMVGDMLVVPRLLFAQGQDGLLPRAFGAVHPRFRTPYVAIIVYAVVCCGLALSGSFVTLAFLSAGSVLPVYFLTCAAVPVLRRRGVRLTGEPFRIPFGPVVPVLSCVLIIALLGSLSRTEMLGLGAVVAGAIVLHLVRRPAIPEA